MTCACHSRTVELADAPESLDLVAFAIHSALEVLVLAEMAVGKSVHVLVLVVEAARQLVAEMSEG